MIDVWKNKRYVHINIESLKGNAWESEMYLHVYRVQREYTAWEPPLSTKKLINEEDTTCGINGQNKSNIIAIDQYL